jgi:hypothetical protein
MTRRVPMTKLLIALCFLIGISIFAFKYFVAGFPLFPNEQIKSWHIESKIMLENPSENIKIALKTPEKTPYYSQVDERFVSGGFGRYPSEDGRSTFLSKHSPSSQEVIYYHTVVYGIKSASGTTENYAKTLTERFKDYPLIEAFDTDDVRIVLENIHQELTQKSSDKSSYINSLFEYLRDNKNDNLRLLEIKSGKENDKVMIAVEILRYAGIPARQMNGILLSEAKKNTKIVSWVEAVVDNHAVRFSPDRDKMGMPSNIFPWYEGYGKIYDILSGTSQVKMEFSVKHHIESALTESFWNGTNVKSFLYKVSVYNMPVEIQLVMSMLLLIPIGAVVCVFLKQMIGIPTFGTFMPVLVAISFRETGFMWGIIFFSSIVAIGMLFRSLFDNLKLLVVPRLSAILTIVVGIIFVLSFTLNRFSYNAGGLSLFPLIIFNHDD